MPVLHANLDSTLTSLHLSVLKFAEMVKDLLWVVMTATMPIMMVAAVTVKSKSDLLALEDHPTLKILVLKLSLKP